MFFNVFKTLFFVSNVFVFTTHVFAQNRPALFYNPTDALDKYSIDAELSLEAMQDQLRPANNPNRSNIRNLSLGLNFRDNGNKFRFEILGEQSPLTNDINMAVGEFYVVSTLNTNIPTQIFAGATKLEYGILNDLDGVLSFLPSYYNVLYDLPRGIDSGLGMNTAVLNQKLSLSGFVFLGRNLRQVDAQNQRLDVAPHHLKLTWNENDFKVSLNYFSRKYETQSLIQGLGLEFTDFEIYFLKSWIKLNLSSEVFALQTSLNGATNRGFAGLVYPELQVKSVLLRSILALEQWTQNGKSSLESYSTVGLGYEFNKNIKAYFERSEINNLTNSLVKEQSYQIRLISQWNF